MKLRDNIAIESASCSYIASSGVDIDGFVVALQTGSLWLWGTNNADYMGEGYRFRQAVQC